MKLFFRINQRFTHLVGSGAAVLILSSSATATDPDQIEATCRVGGYGFAVEEGSNLIDQFGVEQSKRNFKVVMTNTPMRPARGKPISSYSGSDGVDIGRGYSVGLQVEYMPKLLDGDFVRDVPAIAMTAFFNFHGKVLSSTADSKMGVLEQSIALLDSHYFDALKSDGAKIHGLLGYGSGFNNWASLRDHLKKRKGSYSMNDVRTFLGTINRKDGVFTNISLTCSFPQLN